MSPIKLVQDLYDLVGAENVSTDIDVIKNAGFPGLSLPEAVVFPGCKEEICQVVSYANDYGIPIIPIGAGTNIRRVLSPAAGGIGISLRRMNRLLEFEPDNLSLVAEAGVTNEKLQRATEEFNLFLPVYPDYKESTIGGEVSAAAGSRKRGRYGHAVDYVLGVEFVSPNGQLVKTGGKTVKNASGYDFTKMLGGSWGTMGVITSVTLKLQPLPEKEIVLLASYQKPEEAVMIGNKILESKLHLSSLDLFAGREAKLWADSGETVLVSGIEGSMEAVAEQRRKMAALMGANTQVIDNPADLKLFWERYHQFRRTLAEKDFIAAAFDKRLLNELGKTLAWIDESGGSVQLDIASGMLEFSLFEQKESARDNFFERWDDLVGRLGQGIRISGKDIGKKLILERILPKIDPAGVMFPSNSLLRGVSRG